MDKVGIISAKAWWRELSDEKRIALIWKVVSPELESGALTKMVLTRGETLPPKMVRHYLSVLTRIKTNEIELRDADDAKLLKFPKYNTLNGELTCNILSAMLLINHCFPARRKAKKEIEFIV